MKADDYVNRGPCAFCGFPDAGHRVWDSIAGRIDAGESERCVADDYELSIQGVRALYRRSHNSDTDARKVPNRFSRRTHRTGAA